MLKTRVFLALALGTLLAGHPAAGQSPAPDFVPDRRFQGSQLAGWPALGQARWRAHDFTGDGWPDVLATESRQMVLYVNPRGEPRRWDRHLVLPGVTTELTLMDDIDRDGRPEIVYAIANVLAYAKYDPAKPTEPWAVHCVSAPDVGYFHGLGVGDVDGDGRNDILQAGGWWEQPAAVPAAGLWRYHRVAFGRWSRSEAPAAATSRSSTSTETG